jgi:hypothetical protein
MMEQFVLACVHQSSSSQSKALSRWRAVGVALAAAVLLAACNTGDFIRQVNSLLTAPGFALQQLRSIQTNEQALAKLDRVDLAVGMDTARIATIVATLPSLKSVADQLGRNGLTIDGAPTLTPLPGAFKVQLGLHKKMQKDGLSADVGLEVTGVAVVSGYQDKAFVSLRFDTVQLTTVDVDGSWPGKWFTNLDNLVPAANSAARAVLPLLNDAVERYFNETNQSAISLQFPKIQSTNLANPSQAGGLILKDKSLDFVFSIAAAAVLVDETGVVLMAKLDAKAPDPTKASDGLASYPPFDSNQSVPTADQIRIAFSNFSAAYQQRYINALGEDAPPPAKPPFAVVAKPFLAQTLAGLVNTGPNICGSAPIHAAPAPFGSDLTFPNFGEAKCPGYFDACTYKDICANQSQCERSVTNLVDSLCPGIITETVCNNVVKHIPLVGGVLGTICNTADVPAKVACKVEQHVVEPVESPVCNAFRATKLATPLLCTVASNTNKAACDAITAPTTLACQAEQTLRSVIAATPYAHVDGRLTATGNADACITEAEIDAGIGSMNVHVTGSAQGHADLALSYHNKIAPGIGLCTVDWSETFGENVSVTLNSEPLVFAITTQPPSEDDGLRLNFRSDAHQIKADLSPAPIEAVFAKHPQLIANCHIAAVAALAFIGYDTVINEKLRALSPYATGHGVPFEVKPFGFTAAIAPLRLQLPGVHLALRPTWGLKSVGFK